MGNIFACLIRTEVNTFSLGSLSHSYAKRCTSCASRQYTSSNTCRFCGGNVVELDPADAAHHHRHRDGRQNPLRRAAGGASALSAQSAGHSIPVILAHDPETDQIIRYVQDHRGMLIRISGPGGDGRSMRSEHPDAILGSSAGGDRDNVNVMDTDLEKLRQELGYLPKTNDGNMADIEQAVQDLADTLQVDRRTSLPPPSQAFVDVPSTKDNTSTGGNSSNGLQLRSIGSGRMTESGARIVPLLQHKRQIKPPMRKKDVAGVKVEFTQHDITQAIEHTRQLLSCPVCLSEYTTPVTLPCGHSLCASHLGDIAKKTASCPICRDALPPCLIKLGRYMKSRTQPTTMDNSVGKETRDYQGRRVVIVGNPHTAEARGRGKDIDGDTISGGDGNLPAEVIAKVKNEDLLDSVEMLEKLVEIAEERRSKVSTTLESSAGVVSVSRHQRQTISARAAKQKTC